MPEGKEDNLALNQLPVDPTQEDWVDLVLPETVKEFRNKLKGYKRPEKDKYGDGLLADAYIAAKECPTGALGKIAKKLGMDRFTLDYYMSTYPDFTMAIRVGQLDGRQDMIHEIQGTLIARALGMEYQERRVEEQGVVDEDGNLKNTIRKVVTTNKVLPPDITAALEILRKIDPSWNPKSTVEFSLAGATTAAEDVAINIDYRNLSPNTLRELIASQSTPDKNVHGVTIDGGVVDFIGKSPEYMEEKRERNRKAIEKYEAKEKARKAQIASEGKIVSSQPLSQERIEEMAARVRKPMSEETKAKISEAMKRKAAEKKGK